MGKEEELKRIEQEVEWQKNNISKQWNHRRKRQDMKRREVKKFFYSLLMYLIDDDDDAISTEALY